MALGILEPGDATDVTGTVIMTSPDQKTANSNTSDSSCSSEEKLKVNGNGVILSPQPHDNPNDPLNWPIWRRDVALLVMGIYSFMVGGQTPLLAPVMSTLETQFDKDLHSLTYLVGTLMLAMGVGSMIFAPTAVLYGKRLVYLISQAVFFAGCIWGANANSFGSLMGARVLTGIGAGPAESLPSATIAEIFFAHERAYRLGIYTLLMLGGKNLVPLVSGFIANSLHWHWIYWILTIIIGVLALCTFLFVHETWWDRTPIPSKRSQEESRQARIARQKMHRSEFAADYNVHVCHSPTTPSADTPGACDNKEKQHPSRTPFLQNLAVYTGRKTSDKALHVFFRPFLLYTYPPVIYSMLLYGTSVVWLSVIAETISSIFRAPPYNFPITSVGLLYVGTFIGGCLGSAVCGVVSDHLVRLLSRKNRGVYEPEFRLFMVLPVFITTSIGLMGFGWSTFDKDAWIVPTVFLGFLGFGTSLGSTVAITYSVDSYKKYAAEALVAINIFKNVLGFCFGIFVPIFLGRSGLRTTYIVYGCLNIFVCILGIPMYIFGKRARAYRDKYDLLLHFSASRTPSKPEGS